LVELDSTGSLPKSYPVPVQAIRFGESLTMVAVGGETTIDYSLRLKRELGEKLGAPVWVAGYSNDVMGYIPSDRVLKEGGYEGKSSMRYARSTIHPNTWAPGIEETLVGKLHELMDSLD
jgi:neutral ceramidase